jgi:hypothetical protein
MQEPAHDFSGVREAMYEAEPALVDLQLAGRSAPVEEAARGPVPLPEEIRPRSRLREAGAEALSAAELLAVLLCAFPGTNEEGAHDLAVALLRRAGGLHGLLRSSPRELIGIAGIGGARAAALLAAAELGKRMVSARGHRVSPHLGRDPRAAGRLHGRGQ